MKEIFSIKRFLNLGKIELVLKRKNILISAAAVFSILLLISVSSINSTGQWNMHLVFYPLVLLIGGTVFTSMVFGELHKWPGNVNYLMLPSSILEKWLVKLLSTSILYIIISMVLYLLFSLLSAAITLPIFGRAHPIFNPFHPLIVRLSGFYLIIHSVFFFGSVYFKRFSLVKTLLGLAALGIVFGLFTGIIVRIAFAGFFNGNQFSLQIQGDMPDFNRFIKTLWDITQFTFKFIMPPLFWILTFFRLKESEA